MATTATPGSTASRPEPGVAAEVAPPVFVPRFGATERLLHWVHAVGFFGMLGSGLVLYLPSLSASIGDRPTVKAVHLAVSIAWITAIALISVAGDRKALRRTRADLEHYIDDDLRWLRGRKVPQGRFNAGQKTHAVLQSALAGLFILSGLLLYLGERDTAFRFPGTVALHDGAMFVAILLVLGHLFLSLVWPATRPALRGIVRGTVRSDWARRHHAAWTPDRAGRPAAPRAPWSRGRWAAVVLLLIVGLAAVGFVVREARTESEPVSTITASAGRPAPGP